MFPTLRREPFAIGPVDTTVFSFTFDKTDRRIERVITELGVPSDITKNVEGVDLVGLLTVDDCLEVVA